MHQAFDSLFELNERAVVGHADHAPVHVRADRITMLGIQPRVRRELLESQRDALLVAVVLQNFYLDLIADIHQIFGMSQPAPGHVGDVQQAVNAAEVHEGSVLGQVLDHSGEDGAFLQVFERLGALFVLLRLEKLLAADHNVATLLVQLDDGNVKTLALHAVEVVHRAQVNLRSRQEGARTVDVHGDAALGALYDDGANRLVFAVGLFNVIPGAESLGFQEREVDVSLFVLTLVAHDVNFVAGLEPGIALMVQHLGQRQHAFRLGADIHHHVGGRELEHRTLEHVVFADGLRGLGREAVEHRGEVLGGAGFSSADAA